MEETKKLKLRPLTKYEQDMMIKSKVKHKQNITKPQVCWGKTFQGAAFIPKPEKIVFKDFDVGGTYTQKVVLTNVSFTFNSFKVLALDPEVKDFFNVEYTPAGRMSAGLTCPLNVTFTPQINSDINTVLPILSETGPIDIPIQCLSKKSAITLDSGVVEFKDVILGEQVTSKITLRNEGALGGKFRVLDRHGEPIPSVNDQTLNMTQSASLSQSDFMASSHNYEELAPDSFFGMLKFPKSGELKGYSSTSLSFSFSPIAVGNFEEEVLIEFDNPSIPSLKLFLKADCIDVPIYVEKTCYDFNVCVLNHTYREKIVLFNRSSLPMKVQLSFPKDCKQHFEFNPTLGFIQGHSSFEIWCKFRPDSSSETMLRDFFFNKIYRIPIKVTGANQSMPVNFEIKLQLTSDLVTFAPANLDFKDLYLQNGASVNFKVKNHSILPQDFAFVRLPSTLQVQPNDGFGTLLPQEELEMTATYRPVPAKAGTEVSKDSGEIYLKTKISDISCREFKLAYSVSLHTAPVGFSASYLEFPGMPIHETSEMSITLTNYSKKVPYNIEIVPPPYELSGLKVTPLVVNKLNTTKSTQVVFKFNADFRDLQKPDSEEDWDHTAELQKLGGTVYDFDREDINKRSQHYEWLIPVFFRSVTPDAATKRVFLKVRTAVFNKTLIADPEVLEFGEVAVSCRKVVEFNLTNKDTQPLSIRKDPLQPFGGFAVLNALRVIEPGQTKVVVVEFAPLSQQLFEENLTLRSSNSATTVKLKGRGVRPEIEVVPKDGLVYLGNTIANDTIEQTVNLKNIVSFPCEFEIRQLGKGVQNFNGVTNFSYIPNKGKIQPGQTLPLKVRFNPDHQHENYFEHILVDIPNQIEPKHLYIEAACWKRSLYVKYDKPFTWPQNLENKEPQESLNFLKASSKQSVFTLTFLKDLPELSPYEKELTRTRTLTIGNCKLNDHKSEKPGNFEITLPKLDNNLITVDLAKGSVAPGNEQKVKFTFNPPAEDPLIEELEVLQGVGQWVEVVAEGKITGGWVKPGEPDQENFQVVLKAYVKQI